MQRWPAGSCAEERWGGARGGVKERGTGPVDAAVRWFSYGHLKPGTTTGTTHNARLPLLCPARCPHLPRVLFRGLRANPSHQTAQRQGQWLEANHLAAARHRRPGFVAWKITLSALLCSFGDGTMAPTRAEQATGWATRQRPWSSTLRHRRGEDAACYCAQHHGSFAIVLLPSFTATCSGVKPSHPPNPSSRHTAAASGPAPPAHAPQPRAAPIPTP